VTKVKGRSSGTRGKPPALRTWEPMSVTRIGTFGDILRGGSGKGGDSITKKV